MRFKHFTRPTFLRSIGRPLLERFFARFADELAARKIELPARDMDEDRYYSAVAFILMSPDKLVDSLMDAMFAIEEMATPEGQERLEHAAADAELDLQFNPESSHGDIAMQVWLAAPALLARKHNEQRMSRLCKFECVGSRTATQFGEPDTAAIDALTGSLDKWFAAHNRGHQTTQIEAHRLDDEWWFMVRHGDTFARKAKVEKRRTEILHYRPAKDDVVLYSPKHRELRIHAGTKGEKELYRRTFGERLFGNAEHFSERKVCSLEVLREDCAAALNARGLPGVAQIVLREAELAWGRKKQEFMIRGGTDIHASAQSRGRNAIPEYGTVVRAVFDFYFHGQKKPGRVEIRTPNTVKIGRNCDPRVVHEWLSANGFRVTATESQQQQAAA